MSEDWKNEVRNWVWALTGHIVGRTTDEHQALRVKYVDAERMPIWYKAFKHETVDDSPNHDQNYERLEFIGDKILFTIITQDLMFKLPQLDASGLSELSSYYTSAPIQKKLLVEKNDPKASGIFLVGSGINSGDYNLESDLFEGIFGATFFAAESISPGSGYAACSRLFKYYYSNVVYDVKVTRGMPSTQVPQMLLALAPPDFTGTKVVNVIKETPRGEPAKVTLAIDRRITDHLNSIASGSKPFSGGDPNSQYFVIASARGKDVKVASDNAYSETLRILESLGIGWDYAESMRKYKDKILTQQYYQPLMIRLQQEGFTDYEFIKSNKMSTKTRPVLILRGIRSDGTYKRLVSAEGSLGMGDVKKELVRIYAVGEDRSKGVTHFILTV